MTGTSLGLNGEPVKFLGAYVKQISSNLGLSVSPSTATITLAEDETSMFEHPEIGSFHTIRVGPTWSFSGVIIKYDLDVVQIGGRLIRVTMHDAREIMKSAPTILAPGYSSIVSRVEDTGCSVLDVYGAFDYEGLNLSDWNEAGIQYKRLASALNGENIRFGTEIIPVQQQTINAYGETYRFNIDEISDVVDQEYRINTNLTPLSSIIEDLSSKHAFDWFINSSVGTDGIVDVTLKPIDRSVDNIDIGLAEFLADNVDRVVSASSGVELRNELSCLALQGASVEQLLKVNIGGLANEPVNLVVESGTDTYIMTETEMRVVLAGRNSWEMWLDIPTTLGGGGGYSRYGGKLTDDHINPILSISKLYNILQGSGIPGNDERSRIYLDGDEYVNAGKVYEKLKGRTEETYGKRWVHSAINDEIIESAWTRDVVAGDNDPYEYFRQDDGRTRAFVEFSSEDSGGAWSLGLNDLTGLFGADLFRNVTRFGTTFSTVLPGQPGQNGSILVCELKGNFTPGSGLIDMDKSNYTYNNTAYEDALKLSPTVKTTLWVAATVDKDGVVRIESPVHEAKPDLYAFLNLLVGSAAAYSTDADYSAQGLLADDIKYWRNGIAEEDARAAAATAAAITAAERGDFLAQSEALNVAAEALAQKESYQRLLRRDLFEFKKAGGKEDADGRMVTTSTRIKAALQAYFGTSVYSISSRCYQPKYAYIPVRSKVARYGPVFSSELGPTCEGRLEIIQDDGFAPWEFGGVSLMMAAMQLKVDHASSSVKEVFSSNIVIENFPTLNLGDSLDKNSNINSIGISFGADGGVKTTYQLQTFTRKFGELTKEDWARVALYTNSSASRVLPQQMTGFNQRHRFGVDKQITGRGNVGKSTSTGGGGSFD